jgi:uncharacterized protein (TIGR02444 family)
MAFMTDRPLALDNPFWRFSLAVYGEPGVQDACLAVQDGLGGDVNLLLFCAWCGASLSEAQLAALEQCIADWNARVIQPLRAVRRTIKPVAASDAAIADFREAVLAVELRAEQIAQAMLFATADGIAAGANHAATAANVALYLRRLERVAGKPPGTVSAESLIEAASAYRR